MMTSTGSEQGTAPVGGWPGRGRLALALDVDDLVVAHRLARELQPWFGVAKVGLELYSAAGPDAVTSLVDLGFDVFLDLKLHDIPTTVGRAATVIGALGVRYLTLHASGGVAMLRAGVDGLAEGAARADEPPPTALAVTVLTSDRDAPPHIVPKRVRLALDAGCGGLVCGAPDIREVKQLGAAHAGGGPRHPAGRGVEHPRPGQDRSPKQPWRPARLARHRPRGTAAPDPQAAAAATRRRPRRPSVDRAPPRQAVTRGLGVPAMPPPPQLSKEQREAALAKAAAARRSVPSSARSSRWARPPARAVRAAEGNDTIGKTRCCRCSSPSPASARSRPRLMEEIGISEARRVQGLGKNQREALLTAFPS
jgi:orotidine-5'-phosphate decarboxylase